MVLTEVASTTVMMTVEEAERTHKRIVARDKMQAKDLQTMYDLEGWRALGYTSWDSYMRQAFDYSTSYLSRMNDRVKINHQLGAGDDDFKPLNERQTRALKKLDTSDDRQLAYRTAKELADAEDSKLALRHIEMGVKQVQVRHTVNASRHRVIRVMMTNGELTPDNAFFACHMLDDLDDVTYAKVMQIIADYGLADIALIVEYAEMVNRESKTLQRILATGHMNGKPIGKATLEDLKAEKRESQREAIADSVEQKRLAAQLTGQPIVIAHIITVYENDVERTVKALKQVLQSSDILALKALL